ncbi:ISLre2 family transposase, partial [Streptococcus mitis]|nr:ISLre2 family transposase [Streptococcus sp. NLN76]
MLFSELFIDYLSHCLELLDKFLIQPYLEDGWSIDRLEERQITFLFGTVTFKRRRLRKQGEKSFIPLDRALGL